MLQGRLMRTRRSLLLVSLIAAGCRETPTPPEAAADTSGDTTLKKALSTYVVEFLRRNPTTSTYLGGAGLDPSLHDVDGMLRDHSAAALELEDRWLADEAKAIEWIAPASLSAASRI